MSQRPTATTDRMSRRNSSSTEILDVLVIGAGPAGLSAAIYLARFRRTFAVFHDSQSRADWIPRTHNYPGFPGGISGTELLKRILAQAEEFGASVREGRVGKLTKARCNFQALIGGEIVRARKVLLATGVVDRPPQVPGVEGAVKSSLLRICPVCDGFEVIGKRVAVIGDDEAGAREALFLTTYSDAITLIHCGGPKALSTVARRQLADANVTIIEAPVSSLAFQTNARKAVCLTAGAALIFDAAYSALGVRPRSELAVQAGARLASDGRLIVDDHQETSVSGLFAAGDMVRGLNQISTAEGEAAIAATTIHNQLRRNPDQGRRHG